MKKNVLVQEAISLLEELEGVNTEPQPEDQKSLKKKKSSKKKNSNPEPLKTKDVASAIAAASGGNLIAIRLEEKPKLQITNAGFEKLENQKLDTFSKKLRHLAQDAFIATEQDPSDQGSSEKFVLVGGNDIPPGGENNRSGRDYAVQVVDPKSEITHVIPIVSIYSPLSKDKIIGFGAEWAVYNAIIGGQNDKSIQNDKRIKSAYAASSEQQQENFLNILNTMSNTFNTSGFFAEEKFGWGAPHSSVEEPVSATGEADVVATDSENKKFVFHVKYRSQRIGSIPLDDEKYKPPGSEKTASKTASEIYQGLRDKKFRKGKFIKDQIEKFKKELVGNTKFVNSLIFGVKKKLGIEGLNGAKHILVNFENEKSVKLSILGISNPEENIELSITASSGSIANPAFHVITRDKIVANVEIHPKIYGRSGKTSGKYLQVHKGPDFSSLFEGQKIDEFSGAGAVGGVSVPLGKNASGEPEGRPASKVLKKNADIYGKSWGGAKPPKEAIELLGILREEKGQ